MTFLIQGYLASANMDTNEINIREKGSEKPLTLTTSKQQIREVVRFFLGENVEVEAEKGVVVLNDIRWAV